MSHPSSNEDEKSQISLSKGDESPQNGGAPGQAKNTPELPEYPITQKRIVIMAAVYLAVFLVTLDQNIISTATPKITDQFDSLPDVGWYATAYLLMMCSFQLLTGKIYKFYPTKPWFISGCLLFEIGSAVCGAAPSSNAFIVGRAIQGLGSSAMFSGAMVIMFYTIPLQQRPIYQGAFGGVFALGSVIGPLVGGSFTDKVTWRWCFYINLPVGAVSILITILFLHLPNQKLNKPADTWMGKVKQLDPFGTLMFLPGIICLVLALQWGGTKYAWNSARIIVLFVIFGVMTIAFIAVQIWKQEEATIPPRLIKKRSIAAATWFSFFIGTGMNTLIYYLPIWFQAVKNVSAIESGIMLLPLILSSVIFSMSAGIIVSKVGYFTPFFILSSIIMPIGAGLLTTFTTTISQPHWIGYQIILGLGFGLGMQQSMLVTQTILDKSDVATGTAIMMFSRFLGPAVFLPVAESIFLNGLVKRLTGTLPGISATQVVNAGATQLRNLASGDDLQTLLTQYSASIVDVFYLVTATCAVTIFGSVLVEWVNLRARAEQTGDKKAKPTGDKTKEQESV